MRPALIGAVALVAIVGAVVVTPAFGLLLDVFGRHDVSFSKAVPAATATRRDFNEMSIGAPPGMDPRVAAGETRLAGSFDFGGSQRKLWVAPTFTGGFCYLLQGISGGCVSPTASGNSTLEVDGGFEQKAGEEPSMDKIAGKLFDPRATKLQVSFEDGTTIGLPFIYVSTPINAGFYIYKPTALQQKPGHRPVLLALYDNKGQQLGKQTFDWQQIAQRGAQIRAGQKQLPLRSGHTPTKPLEGLAH
jgi:MFS family permease